MYENYSEFSLSFILFKNSGLGQYSSLSLFFKKNPKKFVLTTLFLT